MGTLQDFILSMLENFECISYNDDLESSPLISLDLDGLLLLILERIVLLVNQCETILPSKKPIIKRIKTKIFALRCNARFCTPHIRKLWSRCLEHLTDDSESFELTICKEICEGESLDL